MNYCALRIEEGKKDHEVVFQKLANIAIKLDVLDHQVDHSKIWIQGLVHQVQLMSNGSKVTIAPLLVKSPNNILTRRLSSITVMACPICDFFNENNDIIMMSCGCTYHPFCLIMYIMELKVDACARLTCQEVFSNHWITKFGFK